jgi:hypothetical protein
VNNKTTIKVIKKQERLMGPKTSAPVIPDEPQQPDSQDLAKTVTSWVRDFKKRNNPELPTKPTRTQPTKRKNAA